MQPDTIHGSGQLVPGANKSGYIPVLDGWRGVAILLVLCYHALLHADVPATGILSRVNGLLQHLGPFGVLIFFMISGYLITGRLIAEHDKTGRLSLSEFYYKRAFRILPLSYFYLGAILLLSLVHVTTFNKADGSAAIFVANYVGGRTWSTGHFWSLSIEEHFYLIWPPIVALAGWRRAFWIGAAVVLAEAVWRPWVLLHAADRYFALERTDMRIDFLMVGSIVAIAASEWPAVKEWLIRLGSPVGCVCCIAGLALTLAPWPFDPRSFQVLMLAALVCGTAVSNSPLIGRLLANRPLLFIGQISYSIYILQQPFFNRFQAPWLNKPPVEFVKVLLVIGISYLSYRYIETPFIRYARQQIRRKEAAAALASSAA